MKAQTQALTAVLITTVTVAVIASAYTWGTPLLEKQQQENRVQELESSAVDLYRQTVSVSRSGSGSVSNMPMQVSSGKVEVIEENDSIIISRPAPGSTYSPEWSLVHGESLQNISIGAGSYGIEGQDLPGVVMARSAGDNVRYRIEFRTLRSGDTLQKIDLEQVGASTSRGDLTVSLRSAGTTQDRITLRSQSYSLERRVVEVDLR